MGGEPETYVFYDGKQQAGYVRMFISNASTVGDANGDAFQIALDLAGLSNTSVAAGNAVRSHGPYTSAPVPVAPGASATYLDVADKAVFVFQDAQGGLHKYQVPCPKSSIFQADQETIDFTVAAVKLFVADVTATTFSGTAPTTVNGVVTRNGVKITASVGGYRRRGKAPRKFNIYTRNALLTGGGGAP